MSIAVNQSPVPVKCRGGVSLPGPIPGVVYIYALKCPDTEQIRYVGKSVDLVTRLANHLSEARSGRTKSHKIHWLQGLLIQNKKPVLVVLEIVTEETWPDRERHYIALHRSTLTNTTEGGEGCTAMRGRKQTPEHREKLRLANLGKNKGRKHTNEWKQSNAERMKGRSLSAESRAKISESNKRTKAERCSPLQGKELPAEWRAAIAAGSKGKKMSAESCAKMSAAKAGRTLSSETRAKMAAAQQARRERQKQEGMVKTGQKASPETRAKMAASQQAKWAARKNSN